ncbi:MAG: DUF3883 domain-containing protein [Rhodocyclaceae bacterium]|nr:DUF3883 domain-containing protein [Rhodocyclaceae bacterium]
MTVPFSPGVVQGSFDLLDLVARNPGALSFRQITSSFAHFGAMRSDEILQMAQGMGWLRADENGMATLTPSGSRLVALQSYEPMLRQALLDHIDAESPPWVQCATYGRSRVMAFAGNGVAQVFVEAGLANGFDDDVVAFWDELAARARGLRDAKLSALGREGERLTIKHEEARTGRKPKWVAINNNADGYDVLSVVGEEDSRALSIEVKASSMGLSGSLHLTRNEWEMSQERERHLFHLWDLLSNPPRLAKVPAPVMLGHIPADAGRGRWEGVEVPFSAFAPMFEASGAR